MAEPTLFPGRGKVALLRTRPETILDDYDRLVRLVGVGDVLSPSRPTLLNLNLTWQWWYPSANSPPWQFEGIVRALLDNGFERQDLRVAYGGGNSALVRQGSVHNRLKLVQRRYGIDDGQLRFDSDIWVPVRTRHPLTILDQLYPEGVYLPSALFGANLIQLPTLKTDAFTLIAGAGGNTLGGWLEPRRWNPENIHDAYLDMLQIQRDTFGGILGVMDGTFAGEGPGPRALRPYVKNTLLASADPIALDAVAAKLLGIDPLRVRYIRRAHQRGLGVGDPKEIEIIGDSDLAQENWHFEHDSDTVASWALKQTAVEPFKPLTPVSSAAARFYTNDYFYPFVGSHRAEMMLNTAWGQKFLQYSEGLPFNPGARSKKRFYVATAITAAAVGALGYAIYSATRARRKGNS